MLKKLHSDYIYLTISGGGLCVRHSNSRVNQLLNFFRILGFKKKNYFLQK